MDVDLIGPLIIHQTTSKVEGRIAYWITWLRSDSKFALGDAPRPVFELEQELKHLTRDFARLRIQFDDDDDTDIFIMYEIIEETLNDALDLVRCIREREQGSISYTRQALHLLTKCSHQLRNMVDNTILLAG